MADNTVVVEVATSQTVVEIVSPADARLVDTVDTSPPVVVEIVTAGAQGPQGPRGVNAGTDLDEFETVAAANGAQSIVLPSPSGGSHILYINGLAQRRSAYSVSGTGLTLPGTLQIEAGDTITFDYAPA